MAMVREQDVFFALGPALDFADRAGAAANARPQRLARRALGAAAFAIGFLPQLLAYQRLNGHPAPSRLVTRKMTWTAPHALEVLFSPAHGFFFWTPLACFAIAGLVVPGGSPSAGSPPPGRSLMLADGRAPGLRRRERRVVEVAGAFGQRRFVALTVLLTIGLAASLGGQSQRRAAFGPHRASSCCACGGTSR